MAALYKVDVIPERSGCSMALVAAPASVALPGSSVCGRSCIHRWDCHHQGSGLVAIQPWKEVQKVQDGRLDFKVLCFKQSVYSDFAYHETRDHLSRDTRKLFSWRRQIRRIPPLHRNPVSGYTGTVYDRGNHLHSQPWLTFGWAIRRGSASLNYEPYNLVYV